MAKVIEKYGKKFYVLRTEREGNCFTRWTEVNYLLEKNKDLAIKALQNHNHQPLKKEIKEKLQSMSLGNPFVTFDNEGYLVQLFYNGKHKSSIEFLRLCKNSDCKKFGNRYFYPFAVPKKYED